MRSGDHEKRVRLRIRCPRATWGDMKERRGCAASTAFCGPNAAVLMYSVVQSRAGVTMMAEGVARRDAVAGAALAAGVAAAVVAPQAASARSATGKETGAFAPDSYSSYQKGRPRNLAPVVSKIAPVLFAFLLFRG